MSEENAPLSMTTLAQEAGITYGTLSHYLRRHGNRIPSELRGNGRFFPLRAIEIVREIARENARRRGRKLRRRSPEKAVSDEVMSALQRATALLEELEAELDRAYKLLLDHPLTVVLSLRSLGSGLVFRQAVEVLIEPDGPACVARLVEVNLCAGGESRQEAMDNLRAVIVETYLALRQTAEERWSEEMRQKAALLGMVRPFRRRSIGAQKKRRS